MDEQGGQGGKLLQVEERPLALQVQSFIINDRRHCGADCSVARDSGMGCNAKDINLDATPHYGTYNKFQELNNIIG